MRIAGRARLTRELGRFKGEYFCAGQATFEGKSSLSRTKIFTWLIGRVGQASSRNIIETTINYQLILAMTLTQKEIAEVLAKKPENRYKYFIKSVMKEEEVWGLADKEGWLLLEDEEDDMDVLAVFPNREFAKIFRKEGGFEEFQVEALDLQEFMDWLEDFEKQNMKVAVFPTPDFQSAVMTPNRIKADFKAEFDKEMD